VPSAGNGGGSKKVYRLISFTDERCLRRSARKVTHQEEKKVEKMKPKKCRGRSMEYSTFSKKKKGKSPTGPCKVPSKREEDCIHLVTTCWAGPATYEHLAPRDAAHNCSAASLSCWREGKARIA